MRVNGINTTIQSIMLIVSPVVSGALLPIMDMGYILLIDVITAVIGVGILLLIKLPYTKTISENEEIKYFETIVEGLKYVKEHKFIKTFLKFYAVLSVLIAPIALLTPLLVTRSFGAEEWRLTLNEMVFFVGSIAGGGIISVWGGFKNKIRTIALACFIYGVLSIIMGFSTVFTIYLIMMGFMGITMPMFNTPSIVILQEAIEEKMYGRVFSIVQIIGSGIMPLSMVIYGPLADKIKIEILIIITGILFCLIPIFLIKNKNLQEYTNLNEMPNNQ